MGWESSGMIGFDLETLLQLIWTLNDLLGQQELGQFNFP